MATEEDNVALTQVWWALLSAASVANIIVMVWLAARPSDRSLYSRLMRGLAFPYTLGCAYRSFLPRVDAERVCLVDHPLSWIFWGRSAATIAELAFFGQLCLATAKLAHDLLPHKRFGFLVPIVDLSCVVSFVGIAAAECFSWSGVITRNQYWQTIEESLWMYCSLTLTACCVALILAWRNVSSSLPKNTKSHAATSAAWTFLYGFALFGPIYALYMYLVDVPMYMERYLHSLAINMRFLPFNEGLAETFSCAITTQSYAVWLPEMYWMTPYFTACVWVSLWLMTAPTFRAYGRTDASKRKRK